MSITLKKEDLDKMSKTDLYAMAKKLENHEEAKKYNKDELYLKHAHDKQILFHQATNRVRQFYGGNRSGKTTGGTLETLWRLKGTHPHVPCRVPIKAVIILQDFQTHANDIIIPKIHEWAPPDLFTKIETNQTGTPVKWRCKNGSVLDIKSHDQNIKVFEGSDYDFAWFDEPPPKPIFDAVWRGLTDRGGKAIITGTPLTEPWLFDLYQKAAAENNEGMYWSIYSDMEDNVLNIGEGDYDLGMKRINEFLDAIDPEERETRKKGVFLHMQGLIFKAWNRGTHMVKPFPWPTTWPVIISVDPHPRKPWAVSFLGSTPSGNRILLRSDYVDGVVSDVAEHILWARSQIELDGPGNPKIWECYIDNYASVDSMIKRTTILDELNSIVSPTIPKFKTAPKNVEQKIDIFKTWLKPMKTKYGERATFLVLDIPENKDFIWEIEHYVWAKKRGMLRAKLKDTPEKEKDDILDTIMQIALVLGRANGEYSGITRPQKFSYVRR